MLCWIIACAICRRECPFHDLCDRRLHCLEVALIIDIHAGHGTRAGAGMQHIEVNAADKQRQHGSQADPAAAEMRIRQLEQAQTFFLSRLAGGPHQRIIIADLPQDQLLHFPAVAKRAELLLQQSNEAIF